MANVQTTPRGQKKLVTPIRERVGQGYVQPFGVIQYSPGATTPLQFLKQGVLSYVDIHFTGTLSYTQAAGAAAWTAEPGFPWNMINLAQVIVGSAGSFDQSVTGYGLYLRNLFQHPGTSQLTGGYAYSAALPAANSGTSAVTGTETWSWRYRVPITFSETDLQGLLYLQSQSVAAYLRITTNPLASLVTIPSGSSGTISGQFNITGYGYDLGALTPTDLSIAHVLEETPYAIAQGVTYAQVPLTVGEIVQRMILSAYVNNYPDTTGQVPLETIELQVGISRMQRWSADELRYANAQVDQADMPPGVWVMDYAKLGGTQALDWRTTPQAFLNLTFSSAVPAAAQINVLYEYQRLFGALA
jgi:hypothetical protein